MRGRVWLKTPPRRHRRDTLPSTLRLSRRDDPRLAPGRYVYDNNFIYFQPGNGKVKTKEPKDQIAVAKTKLKAIIASL